MKKLYPEIESVIGLMHLCFNARLKLKNVLNWFSISTHWVLNSFCKQINVSNKVENLMKNHLEYKFQKQFDDISIDSMVKKINTKGMIIHCENDLDAPVKHAKHIHKNWKNSKLVLTQNLGRKILKNKEVSNYCMINALSISNTKILTTFISWLALVLLKEKKWLLRLLKKLSLLLIYI